MTPLRVLYVDDDADIRTIVGLALSLDSTLIVDVAASGTEALAQLDAGIQPDVAVLDVMMPGIDGPALFQRIRERETSRDLPVIFMTAKAQPSDVARFHEQGAIGVIRKPFDPIHLAGEIRAMVQAHHARMTQER